MKGCIVAGVIVLLVAVLVAVNAAYVTHVSTKLDSMWRALPSTPDPTSTPDAIRRMAEYFDRHETRLGISISFTTLDTIKERMIRLEAYAKKDDEHEYAATLASLGTGIKDLNRHERFHSHNIF
jgi:hypothetical protein